MKIISLKVSNVLSFGHIDVWELAPNTIEFKRDINILIGPNGSGKSNLLEIINQLFFRHFNRLFDFNEIHLRDSTGTAKAIQPNNRENNPITNTLQKHFNYTGKDSKIRIGIQPDVGDLQNFQFISNNWDILDKIYKETCRGGQLFEKKYNIATIEFSNKVIQIDFAIQNQSNDLKFIPQKFQPHSFQEFYYHYLQDFNLLQRMIELLIFRGQKVVAPLNNPYSLISSMRQHSGFNNYINLGPGLTGQIHQVSEQDQHSSTKNYSPSESVYQLINLRLGKYLIEKVFDKGNEYAKKEAEENPDSILCRINSVLKPNLGLELVLENWRKADYQVSLNIKTNNKIIEFNQLSSGQKSVFFLLFTIYGRGIENGLLIIDEPEIHLHTSMQVRYFKILKEIQGSANVQVIIATHSGVFIDEETIKNTIRLSKPEFDTLVTLPKSIDQPQKELLKILTYTNSSRIFFADKVLMVEGDSDEYFFRFFMNNYYLRHFKKERTVEILNIGGKGNFEKWRLFLELFEIPGYFIGDLDSVRDFGVARAADIDIEGIIKKGNEDIISRILKKNIKNSSKDGKALLESLQKIVNQNFAMDESDKRQLTELWAYMMERQTLGGKHLMTYFDDPVNKVEKAKLVREIEKKYANNIFILKQGELEDYLETPGKDLDHVVKFCSDDFETWVRTQGAKSPDQSKLTELINFFNLIYE